MTFRKLFIAAGAVALAVGVGGCSRDSITTTEGVKADKAATKNAPDQNAGAGEGYRLGPANKDDPRFKPDPKLAGGN